MVKKIVFVGSFVPEDGRVLGGQNTACKLLMNSSLREEYSWKLIDSTAFSNKGDFFLLRIIRAFLRVCKFFFYVVFHKIDTVLIFTANGASFIEKGFMVIIASVFSSAKIILAPRSGFIIQEIKSSSLFSFFVKIVFRKTNYVLCQSNKWELWFREYVDNSINYITIENWIDLSVYPKKIVSGNGIPVILFMSWVDKNKGIYEFVDAIKLLEKDFNFIVKIVGDGKDLFDVIEKVSENKLNHIVEFCGWLSGDKKTNILMTSDIFVLPSYAEGYPNSLVEAMAAGLACISSNIGSVSDIINDGVNGLIIEPKSTSQLYVQLSNLLNDKNLINLLSVEGHKSVFEKNDIKKAVLTLREIL